jgi:ABC-type nitrate/sulfonate/bicarbonate transport system substrate-binding protein
MPIKTIAIVIFIAIIASLASALFHLVKSGDEEQSRKTAKALTFRIGLSLGLFVLIFLALAAGLFQPTGIGTRMHQTPSASDSPAK